MFARVCISRKIHPGIAYFVRSAKEGLMTNEWIQRERTYPVNKLPGEIDDGDHLRSSPSAPTRRRYSGAIEMPTPTPDPVTSLMEGH
jgi:hypothetical protein